MASTDWSIPDLWLDRIRGTRLLYPASGADIIEPLAVFADTIDHFTFADLNAGYGNRISLRPETMLPWRLDPVIKRTGDDAAPIARRSDAAGSHREVDPAHTTRTYTHMETERRITVCWRRGFGQYAVQAEPARGLGVFMHRGDSFGDGGSAVSFLANRPRRHAPLANLLAQIETRLADFALVVSDGSNTALKPLMICARETSRPPGQSFAMAAGTRFQTRGFTWELVGYMGMRSGPTLVWGLTRRR